MGIEQKDYHEQLQNIGDNKLDQQEISWLQNNPEKVDQLADTLESGLLEDFYQSDQYLHQIRRDAGKKLYNVIDGTDSDVLADSGKKYLKSVFQNLSQAYLQQYTSQKNDVVRVEHIDGFLQNYTTKLNSLSSIIQSGIKDKGFISLLDDEGGWDLDAADWSEIRNIKDQFQYTSSISSLHQIYTSVLDKNPSQKPQKAMQEAVNSFFSSRNNHTIFMYERVQDDLPDDIDIPTDVHFDFVEVTGNISIALESFSGGKQITPNIGEKFHIVEDYYNSVGPNGEKKAKVMDQSGHMYYMIYNQEGVISKTCDRGYIKERTVQHIGEEKHEYQERINMVEVGKIRKQLHTYQDLGHVFQSYLYALLPGAKRNMFEKGIKYMNDKSDQHTGDLQSGYESILSNYSSTLHDISALQNQSDADVFKKSLSVDDYKDQLIPRFDMLVGFRTETLGSFASGKEPGYVKEQVQIVMHNMQDRLDSFDQWDSPDAVLDMKADIYTLLRDIDGMDSNRLTYETGKAILKDQDVSRHIEEKLAQNLGSIDKIIKDPVKMDMIVAKLEESNYNSNVLAVFLRENHIKHGQQSDLIAAEVITKKIKKYTEKVDNEKAVKQYKKTILSELERDQSNPQNQMLYQYFSGDKGDKNLKSFCEDCVEMSKRKMVSDVFRKELFHLGLNNFYEKNTAQYQLLMQNDKLIKLYTDINGIGDSISDDSHNFWVETSMFVAEQVALMFVGMNVVGGVLKMGKAAHLMHKGSHMLTHAFYRMGLHGVGKYTASTISHKLIHVLADAVVYTGVAPAVSSSYEYFRGNEANLLYLYEKYSSFNMQKSVGVEGFRNFVTKFAKLAGPLAAMVKGIKSYGSAEKSLVLHEFNQNLTAMHLHTKTGGADIAGLPYFETTLRGLALAEEQNLQGDIDVSINKYDKYVELKVSGKDATGKHITLHSTASPVSSQNTDLLAGSPELERSSAKVG